MTAADVPEAFRCSPLGDPGDKPPWAKPHNPDFISGYNACLEATKAADLWRENKRLLERGDEYLRQADGAIARAERAEADRDRLREALQSTTWALGSALTRCRLNGCTDTEDDSLECVCDDPFPEAREALAATDPERGA